MELCDKTGTFGAATAHATHNSNNPDAIVVLTFFAFSSREQKKSLLPGFKPFLYAKQTTCYKQSTTVSKRYLVVKRWTQILNLRKLKYFLQTGKAFSLAEKPFIFLMNKNEAFSRFLTGT